MSEDSNDPLNQVQQYRELVLRYEALDEEIDALIMSYGGTMEKMSPEALLRYRVLARERDDVQNDMRQLEKLLLDDDST